eukprot:1047472-Amphidinium_carterae.1
MSGDDNCERSRPTCRGCRGDTLPPMRPFALGALRSPQHHNPPNTKLSTRRNRTQSNFSKTATAKI